MLALWIIKTKNPDADNVEKASVVDDAVLLVGMRCVRGRSRCRKLLLVARLVHSINVVVPD
jgi:hypothetical protein